MDRHERVRAGREPLRDEQRRRHVVAEIADELERLRVEIAQLLLSDVLGGGIHRGEIGCLHVAVQVVRRDGEAVPVRATSNADRRAGDELRLEPRLVEPGRPDLAGLVGDARGEDLEPPAPPARHRAHDPLDHCLVVAEQIADPLDRRGLLVPSRTLPEQVFDHAQSEACKALGHGRTDTVQRLDGRSEPICSRSRARPRPDLGRVKTREPRQRRASDRPVHSRRSLWAGLARRGARRERRSGSRDRSALADPAWAQPSIASV